MKLKHYLLASDFDQTLSFNDSGLVLSHLIGAPDFTEKVNGLSRMHFIQQGGELAYLLLHDPQYRCVRKEHLIEVGDVPGHQIRVFEIHIDFQNNKTGFRRRQNAGSLGARGIGLYEWIWNSQ